MLESGQLYRHGTAWRLLLAENAFRVETDWLLFSSMNGELCHKDNKAGMIAYLDGQNPNHSPMQLAGRIGDVLPPAASNFTTGQLGKDLMARVEVELKGVGPDKLLHLSTLMLLGYAADGGKTEAGAMLKAVAQGVSVGVAKEVLDAGWTDYRRDALEKHTTHMKISAAAIDDYLQGLDDGDLIADLIGIGLALVTEGVRQLKFREKV